MLETVIAVWFAAQVMDVHSTFYALHRNPYAVEGNPVFMGNPKLIIPIKGAANGLGVVAWRKAKSKKAKVAVAAVFIGSGFVAGTLNYRKGRHNGNH